MNADLSGAEWFKSSFSGSKEACVEVAFIDNNRVGIRDSKNPAGPVLRFTGSEWAAFTTDVKASVFDRP